MRTNTIFLALFSLVALVSAAPVGVQPETGVAVPGASADGHNAGVITSRVKRGGDDDDDEPQRKKQRPNADSNVGGSTSESTWSSAGGQTSTGSSGGKRVKKVTFAGDQGTKRKDRED